MFVLPLLPADIMKQIVPMVVESGFLPCYVPSLFLLLSLLFSSLLSFFVLFERIEGQSVQCPQPGGSSDSVD
jgi:hypothetical protein